MKNLFNALIVLLFYMAFIPAMAQNNQMDSTAEVCEHHGLCCGDDPTPAGVMISHAHAKNEWMVSYRYMNMAMSGVMLGDRDISDSEVLSKYNALPKDMRMNMHMLMLMYGVTDRFTVMGMFHYTTAWMKMSMLMGKVYHAHTMKTAGIGDIKLNAIYAVIKRHNHQLLLSLGASLPAGSIHFKGRNGSIMYPGQRYPYNMQAGTGTFDLQPCVSYLAQHGKLYYSLQASAAVRTTYNAVGYRYGNEAGLMAWMAYRWLPFLSSSLRLEATLTGAMQGNDPSLDRSLEIAADAANYGGKRLNGYVGSVFQPTRGFLKTSKFCMEFGLPLYQHYMGYQMPTDRNVLLTYNLSF